ncbi:TlpA disulfide reductase family protein [Sphaerobacter thermophilus]|uniref:TlpA family protein disulfide reductase n=1 Tax=Sphaerobacter thermophilus TaxID=2057 RepID=UPI0001A363C8
MEREGWTVERVSQDSLRNRIIPTLVVLIVVALLGLFAYAMWFSGDSTSLASGGRINTVGRLIRFENRTAPSFSLQTLDGQQISLEHFRGKTVVLNFWGSWCPPCEDEAPVLRDFAATLDENTVIVGIDIWDQPEAAQAFLEKHDLTYPNAVDDNGRTTIDYGVSGVPETFFIGPDGALLGKYNGPVKSVEQLHGFIQELTGAG